MNILVCFFNGLRGLRFMPSVIIVPVHLHSYSRLALYIDYLQKKPVERFLKKK